MQPPQRLASALALDGDRLLLAVAFATAAFGLQVRAQGVQGPTSSRTPYLVSSGPNGVVRNVTSLLTTTDLVPLTGGVGTYEYAGIPDGLGAYDNGNGTVTVLCNHEHGNTSGVVRAHGAQGAFVSELIIDKSTLAVMSARDLMQGVVDGSGVLHNAAGANAIALNRFCSADLAPVTAFYNAASGLGTTDRIFMNGEEGGATGYWLAHVATGALQGTSYILPKFNLSTNGSGLTGVGGSENSLACPYAQDTTIVIGDNDGGTGIMNNAVSVYIGTKTAAGTPVERAGLTNGNLYFVNVAGNPVEIVNATTRATNIVNGTPFTLSGSSSTTFSRPEDGAWNPSNPSQFYFVTTDRLDVATNTGLNQTIGATGATNQQGKSRLWRLTFTDITNPLLGGVIDLLIDGSKSGFKVQMFDNLTAGADGRVYLTEDPGNSTYIGKVWAYDPATDTLVQLAKFDPARWGDLAVNGGTPGGVSPQTNDKESSGILDVTALFPHAADETVLLLVVQDHSTNAAVATASSVEGGQLLLMKVALGARATAFGAGCAMTLAAAPGSQPVLGSTFVADVANIEAGATTFMMVGGSTSTFVGLPLPLDLGFLGLPGCLLYQDLGLEGAGATAATGATTANYTLPIPGSFAYTGLTVYLQAWSTGLHTSNALTVVLGL